MATKNTQKIGWIGMGRMGFPMAERLIKAGHDVSIWNRTRAKAEPLEKIGGKVVDHLSDLKYVDVLFSIVATGEDVQEVLYGKNGVSQPGRQDAADRGRLLDHRGRGIGGDPRQAQTARRRFRRRSGERQRQGDQGRQTVRRGVRSGSRLQNRDAADRSVRAAGVSYVGDGELARVCKIAHNVMLGVVIENLIEITLLTNKMGVPRHAFLAFLNNGVMGSMFTRYKSPALVNLDWTTTFTPELLRKDLDLGLELARDMDVPMPVTAATREVLQSHFGAAMLAEKSGRISAEGFRGAGRDHGARRRHEAREREQERPDRAGKLAVRCKRPL